MTNSRKRTPRHGVENASEYVGQLHWVGGVVMASHDTERYFIVEMEDGSTWQHCICVAGCGGAADSRLLSVPAFHGSVVQSDRSFESARPQHNSLLYLNNNNSRPPPPHHHTAENHGTLPLSCTPSFPTEPLQTHTNRLLATGYLQPSRTSKWLPNPSLMAPPPPLTA